MGNIEVHAIFGRKLFIIMLWFMFFSRMDSQVIDQPGAGLLCISECSTCPAICTPPPSPITRKSPQPPPSPDALPPLQYSFSPPESFYFGSPPPKSSLSPPPPTFPPPSPDDYISGGGMSPPPPPPRRSHPPPPPSNNVNVIPSAHSPPYYYIYVSEASSSLQDNVALFLILLMAFQALYLHI